MILFFLITLIIFYGFFNNSNKIKGGNYFIKKKCNYQSSDLNLEDKNYIGKITGNQSDFRDFSNNYYCNSPLRI